MDWRLAGRLVPLTKMAGKVSIEAFGTDGPALPGQWLL